MNSWCKKVHPRCGLECRVLSCGRPPGGGRFHNHHHHHNDHNNHYWSQVSDIQFLPSSIKFDQVALLSITALQSIIVIIVFTGERFSKGEPWRCPSKLIWTPFILINFNHKMFVLALDAICFLCSREFPPHLAAWHGGQAGSWAPGYMDKAALGKMIMALIFAGCSAGEKAWLWKERRTSKRSSSQSAGFSRHFHWINNAYFGIARLGSLLTWMRSGDHCISWCSGSLPRRRSSPRSASKTLLCLTGCNVNYEK